LSLARFRTQQIGALVASLSFAVTGLLGLIREFVVLQLVDVSNRDGYFLALTVMAIATSFGSYSVASSFAYPLLKDGDSSRSLEGKLVTIWAILGCAASSVTLLLAWSLANVSSSHVPLHLVASLLAWLSPSVVLTFMAGMFSALCYAQGRIVTPLIGDFVNTSLTTFGVLALIGHDHFTPVWIGLTWTASAFANTFISFWGLRGRGLTPAKPDREMVSSILRIYLPVGLGHLGIIVERIASIGLGPGGIAAVLFARRAASSFAGIAANGSLVNGLASRIGSFSGKVERDLEVDDRIRRGLAGIGALVMVGFGTVMWSSGRPLEALALLGFAPFVVISAEFTVSFQVALSLQSAQRTSTIAALASLMLLPGVLLGATSLGAFGIGIWASAVLLVLMRKMRQWSTSPVQRDRSGSC
jgi:hypothetical protein